MPNTNEVRIKIKSELYEVDASLFSDENADEDFFVQEGIQDGQSDILEINSIGTMTLDGDRVTVSYKETEASGMEGSTTTISFIKSAPEMLTMTREGLVSATLVFEESKRHHCIYKTPFMPFEVCVCTQKVVNSILENGSLSLDYIVEIRGAKAERTKFNMQIL